MSITIKFHLLDNSKTKFKASNFLNNTMAKFGFPRNIIFNTFSIFSALKAPTSKNYNV